MPNVRKLVRHHVVLMAILAVSLAWSTGLLLAMTGLYEQASLPTQVARAQAAPPLGIEAESAVLTTPTQQYSDASAFGGQYITTLTANVGKATLTFSVSVTGTYAIWGRVSSGNSSDPDASNTFHISMDSDAIDNVATDGSSTIWDTPQINAWGWSQINRRIGGNMVDAAVTYNLTAGSHTLYINGREPNSRLDQIIVTSDLSFVPTASPADTAPPTVSLSAPAGGATVGGATVTVSANASDNIGVAGVQFLLDGTNLGSEDTTNPYSVTWNTTAATNGSHTLSARARDAAGNQTTATNVSVTVSNTITPPPTGEITRPQITISSPSNGATLTPGTTVTIQASASDNVGVTKVDFYNGTTLLGTDASSPYSFVWNTTGVPTAQTIYTRAYDAAGNIGVAGVTVFFGSGGSTRYIDQIFTSAEIVMTSGKQFSTITDQYGTHTLLMDIYTPPASDPVALRPLIIWIHGGNFSGGGRADFTAYSIEFARRGYVAATIDYRLFKAYNPSALTNDAVQAAQVDTEAAINYLKANAATYRIDANLPIVGGWSAGSSTSWRVGYDYEYMGHAAPVVRGTIPIDAENLKPTDFKAGDPPWNWIQKDTSDEYPEPYIVQSNILNIPNQLNKFTGASHTDLVAAPLTPTISTIVARFLADYVLIITPPPPSGDTAPPTVSLSAPVGGATVGGAAVTVSANASDNIGVAGVQFLLDGTNLGSEDTTNPYSVTWNTTTATNGSHTISARARDAVGNQTTATNVSVTVSNIVVPPPPASTSTWVVVYYPTWAQRPLGVSGYGLPPIEVDWTGVTHVVHFFGDNSVVATSPYFRPAFDTAFDNVARFGSGGGSIDYQKQLIDTVHSKGGKVVIDLQDITSGALMTITANQTQLDIFADAVATYANQRGYDGVELDWEFWATGSNPSSAQMSALIRTLKQKMNGYPNLKLIIAAPGIGQYEFSLYNTPEGKTMVDMYTLQMYAYSGINYDGSKGGNVAWYMNPLYIGDTRTIAPSFEGSAYNETPRLLVFSIKGWIAGGMDPKKLGIGLPSFARFYHGTDQFLQRYTSGGSWIDEISIPNAHKLLTNGGIEIFDSQRRASYIAGTALRTEGRAIAGEKFWVTLPKPSDIQEDINWAKSLGLGSVMMYEIAKDAVPSAPYGQRHPIMSAIVNAVGSGVTPPPPSGDTAPPTVSLTAPAGGATVGGATVTVSANASDNIAVAGVQFLLDGTNLSVEDTTSPYSVTWNTTTATNGTHILSARARDAAGNMTTATLITVSVSNVIVTPPPTGFVSVDKTTAKFMLGGQPFYFAASNAYYLQTYEKLDPVGVVNDVLNAFVSNNITVVRTDGFHDGTDCGYFTGDPVIQTAPGVYDETALQYLDRVVKKAKDRNIKLIVTLTNYWKELGGICQYNKWAGFGPGGANPTNAEANQFYTNTTTKTMFKNYISMLLNRINTQTGIAYKNEPTIMAWELINEGRNPVDTGSGLVLRNWYQEIAQFIKGIDQNHLVDTGEEGFDENTPSQYSTGYTNTFVLRAGEGTSYILNTQIPEIDFGNAHLYPLLFGLSNAINDGNLFIKDHNTIAKTYGKPFFLGEYGHYVNGWTADDLGKINTYGSWWSTIEQQDVAGDALWQFVESVKCGEYGGNICYTRDPQLTSLISQHGLNMKGKSGSPLPADTTAPTVSLTAPTSGATVSGSATVSVNASDNIAVAGVQFMVDGVNLGPEQITSPYSLAWNTTASTNGSYTITARARDAVGNTTISANVTVTVSNIVSPPGDTTPPVVSGIGATNITSSGFQINWTTSEPANSQVEHGPTIAYGSLTTLDNTLLTTHAQTIVGRTASTLYHYRVLARDGAGNLSISSDNTVTTLAPADTTPPTITNILTPTLTTTGATITWTTNEASDSQIEYGLSTAYGSMTVLNTSLLTSHSVGVTGLASNTTYNLRVRSRDAAGNLTTSGNTNFTTASAGSSTDTTPPIISNIGTSLITSATATITWTTNELSSSQVDYGVTTSYGSSTVLNNQLVLAHTTALKNLARGTTYHYRVRSTDGVGNNAFSIDQTFITLSRLAKPPKVRTLQASLGSVKLSWVNPTDYEWFSGVAILKSTTGYLTTYDASAQVFNPTTLENWTDTDVSPDTTYYYSFFVYDDVGIYSDPEFVSIKTVPLSQVTGGGGGGFSLPRNSPTTNPPEASLPPPVRFSPVLIPNEVAKLVANSLAAQADVVGAARSTTLEQRYTTTFLPQLAPASAKLPEAKRTTILSFVTYGTPSTVRLGSGERAGVVASFKVAYGKSPQTEVDWHDVLKLASGRTPSLRNLTREKDMAAIFRRIYLRVPGATSIYDQNAVTILTYGLRVSPRNLKSEQAALKTFRAIFRRLPKSSADWDTLRAIAYSGAKR